MQQRKEKQKIKKRKNDNNKNLISWCLICGHWFARARGCCCFNCFYIVLNVFGTLYRLLYKGLRCLKNTFLVRETTYLVRTITYLVRQITFLVRETTYLVRQTTQKILFWYGDLAKKYFFGTMGIKKYKIKNTNSAKVFYNTGELDYGFS
ncbi:hypothetical protein [Cysteiniphilum marinum]|uniref:hypothetical protein n=1 Tax=Cysteiniphilum marinum TaxID=2774191 RepID=UPI00193A8E69|nr:hypothetical protein [Cysteiniphilum marinum]